MKIERLFDLLDDWRNLPAYQLERRADIIFAVHLERIFEKCFGTKIDFVIPEFPVRIGEISYPHYQIGHRKFLDITFLCFMLGFLHFDVLGQ